MASVCQKGKERKVKSLSCVHLFAIPWTVACQAPSSMGFSRQEYCSGLPFPSPGDLPDLGTDPAAFVSPASSLVSSRKPHKIKYIFLNQKKRKRNRALCGMCSQSTPPATSIPKIFLPPPRPLPPLAIYFTYGIVSFHVTLSLHLTLS